MLLFQIPKHINDGNYSLKVEGISGKGSQSIIFRNVTRLLFQKKRVSVFIFTDKQVYQKKQPSLLINSLR